MVGNYSIAGQFKFLRSSEYLIVSVDCTCPPQNRLPGMRACYLTLRVGGGKIPSLAPIV